MTNNWATLQKPLAIDPEVFSGPSSSGADYGWLEGNSEAFFEQKGGAGSTAWAQK